MATDNPTYGVNVGSGRFRLPARLAKSSSTGAPAYTANGPQLKNFTTTARNALTGLGASDKGLMVYDVTLSKVAVWNGSAWKDVNNAGTI